MLVTFSSPAYADITMFGDVATQLIKLMGHSDAVPGAIMAEDIKTALEQLVKATQEDQSLVNLDEKEGKDSIISLSQRAFPLIELLESAVKSEGYVMWDKS